jgi:hypothetical protein
MKRKQLLQEIRKLGTARGCLEKVLTNLKAGNLRVHPFENQVQKVINEIDQLFVDFTKTYEE